MTTKRAAKYLNGSDHGKKFSIKGWPTTRTILGINHPATNRVEIACIHPAINERINVILTPDTEVTLHGQPSPPTDDPHGINTRKDQ